MMNKREPILVLGGGHQGLAMAAHLALSGERVRLWNRSVGNIKEIVKTNIISCTGIVKGEAWIERVSCDIKEVISDVIMVTVPAFAHKDVARMLAGIVGDNTKIILNPGRTFGALEFKRELKAAGCKTNPKIAETQTIVYTCRRDEKNKVEIYALKNDVDIAALRYEDLADIIEAIPKCIRGHFTARKSVVNTSIGNVGMVLHCAPVLMNIGWIESKVAEFKYYYDGISKSIAKFLEKLDKERVMVAETLGYEVESVKEWLEVAYHVEGESMYECIRNNLSYRNIDAPKTINHRYLEEDIPYGLVPLECTAKILNVQTPYVSLIIDLASAVRDKDYRAIGRRIAEEELRDICK